VPRGGRVNRRPESDNRTSVSSEMLPELWQKLSSLGL